MPLCLLRGYKSSDGCMIGSASEISTNYFDTVIIAWYIILDLIMMLQVLLRLIKPSYNVTPDNKFERGSDGVEEMPHRPDDDACKSSESMAMHPGCI